jgi:carboxyl-terminal processing protease
MPGATPTQNSATAPTLSPHFPRLQGQGLAVSVLHYAYTQLLDTYVDTIDDRQLISGGIAGLRNDLNGQPLLPIVTLAADLVPDPTGETEKDFQALAEAYESISTKLPAWSANAHPDWAVLRGMAESLHDGHTTFLTPDEARRRSETSFAGIGVLLSRPQDDQAPLITEVLPSSPALQSGIKRGDRIVAVDGQSMVGLSLADVAAQIRGPVGSDVHLTLRRASSDKPLEITLHRAQVEVDPVIVGVIPQTRIGYLRVRNFGDQSVADRALSALIAGRQGGVAAWIIDLRGNTGGQLAAVAELAAGLVDDAHKTIGYRVDRLRRHSPLEVRQGLALTQGLPVVLLVDRDTASGAEILAAALQEGKFAELVGSKTAGSVGVATQVQLPDDSVLQITEQRFISPSNALLDGVGVTPDDVVEMTDADYENDRDPQLKKAGQILVQKLTGTTGG